MNSDHLVHGLAGDEIAPDWPALTSPELESLLQRYPQLGPLQRIAWHSPRPLSAAGLVETTAGEFFVKRHHRRVRTAVTLVEEHRFMAYLRGKGLPLPQVMLDLDGQSAVALGKWIYEVHQRAAGLDLYRDTVSWQPPANRMHAHRAGRVLAAMHEASADYAAEQRHTHILVARSELIAAVDPVAALRAQLPQRPGLADYLQRRDWESELAALVVPWHADLQPRLVREPHRWTHGDWHVSNLCWSDPGDCATITAVLDFGLAASNCALFDLAVAIERNAIAWLTLDTGLHAIHPDIAQALIEGYRQLRPLDGDDIRLLAHLLPLVHVDFALSEVEYFHAITQSPASADIAYEVFLRGHADWFATRAGQTLLQAIRDCA